MRRIVYKKSSLLLLFIFLLAVTVSGMEEILLKVDPRLDARGQGFDLAGFSGIRTGRNKKALVLRIPAAPRKTGVYLRTCAGMLARMDTRDLAGAELRCKLTPSQPVSIPVKGVFRIHWMSGEREDLELPVIAALQDWSAFFPHQDAVMPNVKRMEPFELSYDPMGRAQSILGYFSFFRQDVTPHSVRVAVHVRPDEVRKYGESSPSHSLGLLAYLAQFGMVYDKGDGVKLDPSIMPDMLVSATGAIRQPGAPVPRNEAPASISALVNQLRRKKLLPQSNPTNPDLGLYQSANGEVTIDMQKHEMKVATPRLEMCAYKKTAPLPIRNLTILHSSIPASFAAVSLDESRPLNTSGRILLCVATDALNSGMTFDSTKREGLLNAGELPALLRCGQFRLSLKSVLKNPVLYSLNCSGDRLEKLQVVKHQDTIRIDLDTTNLKEPAIFFELVEGI